MNKMESQSVNSNNTQYIDTSLSAFESSRLFSLEPGITKVTFYETQDLESATAMLRERFNKVVQANPWLTGRLIKSKRNSCLQLRYKKEIQKEDIGCLFHNQISIVLDKHMSYRKMYKTIAGNETAYILPGYKLQNSDKPLVSLSIASVPSGGFVVIFSLSHIIADGATYYKIFNALFPNNPIVSMNPKRQTNFTAEKAVGKINFTFLHGKTYLFNLLRTLIFGKKLNIVSFYIDKENIEQEKMQAITRGEVPYISTNDIVSSEVMIATKAPIYMMAMNFRNRFQGLTSNDAGNYEGVMCYDPDSYSTPEDIRKSLMGPIPFNTLASKLPNWWKRLWMKVGLVTNPTCFAGDFELPGCRQTLHIPILPIYVPLDSAIFYNPQPDKLAILLMTRYLDDDYFSHKSNPLVRYLGARIL